MKKRWRLWIAMALLAYVLLLILLVAAESADPEAGIQSFGDALWYSLVTLSTVGYGDLYPVSPLGRAIGLVFVLLSVGALASVIGFAAVFLRERVIPAVRLGLIRRDKCFLFSELSGPAEVLAEDLLRSDPSARAVFCGTGERKTSLPDSLSRRSYCFPQDVTEIARALNGKDKTVFLTGEDASRNYAAARALRDLPLSIYCRGADAGDMPDVRFFDVHACAARAYWQAFPLKDTEDTVLVAGSGGLAREIVSHAVLANCRVPFRAAVYHLFGDWEEYRMDHPELFRVLSAKEGEAGRDALVCHDGAWNSDPELLERAGRVIFCGDEPVENAGEAMRLMKYFPFGGQVFAAAAAVPAPAIAFGRPEEIYSERIVMRSGLDRRAKALHGMYCRMTGADEPWEDLTPFIRASNRSSADHLLTKLRLLLPEKDVRDVTPELCREAAARWEAAGDREPFRQNEHERWMRFCTLYNWRYGPEKDSARRTHPCLVPYGELSEEEREKDDNAWLQIGMLGNEGPDGSAEK